MKVTMLKLTIETVPSGSYIFVEDKAPQDYFYIIQSGTVQCSRKFSKDVRSYDEGNIIGIVSCMTGRSQPESVRAKDTVKLVKVFRSQYEELIKDTPTVAMKIVLLLSRDLRSFNEAYERKAGHSGSGKFRLERLYATACFYEEQEQPSAASFAYYQYMKEAPEGPHFAEAQQAFERLKKDSQAVYLDPSEETNRRYPKGTMIFAEGQSGNELFIVSSGSVRISKIVDGEEQAIVYFKRGEMLGDMALLENDFRSANAIATEDSGLLVLNKKNFDQMVTTQPQYILKLTATLANRYWYSYRRLGNIFFGDVKERLVDMIAMQVEMRKTGYELVNSFETELDVHDLMVLCSLEPSEEANVRYILGSTQGLMIKNGKVVVKDVDELLQLAEYYRKKRDKSS